MLLFIEVSLIKDLDFKGFLHYPIVRSIFFFKNKKSVETEKSLIKDTNFRCFLHQDHHCQLFSKNKHEGSVAKGKNKCKMTRVILRILRTLRKQNKYSEIGLKRFI